MLSVSEALNKIMDNLPAPRIIEVALIDALGYVITEDVFADIDLPPFDKSMMDGYAVRSEDLKRTPVELEVIEVVPAGQSPRHDLKPGKAIKIMTGAPIPIGADAVIMVENTAGSSARMVNCLKGVRPAENIAFHGEDLKANEKVVAAGTTLMPQHIALLAAVGKVRVSVYRKPTIAILSTGDELVEVAVKPQAAQIRNSNTYSLWAQVRQMGFEVNSLGIVRDEPVKLAAKITEGLKSDILIMSGGVSVGDFDIVEDTLRKLGCEIVFERVAVKPGKPLTFCKTAQCRVFGLPGNPVSVFVATEVFIRPALAAMTGNSRLRNPMVKARLAAPYKKTSDRQQYITAYCTVVDAGWSVAPIAGHGSADLVALSKANAFLVVPPDHPPMDAGELVEVMLLGIEQRASMK